jgi:hypothetical protein
LHRREALNCFAFDQKTKGEVRLDDNKIRISGARRADVTGLAARRARVEELALPKSVESGNLSVNKVVIRRMSGNYCLGKPARFLQRPRRTAPQLETFFIMFHDIGKAEFECGGVIQKATTL